MYTVNVHFDMGFLILHNVKHSECCTNNSSYVTIVHHFTDCKIIDVTQFFVTFTDWCWLMFILHLQSVIFCISKFVF